ncbi:Aldo/keto reductase [Clavulina sp. PMI_390]|nr:Aldo/keto reductase [Clavulina sp. PMI_390]
MATAPLRNGVGSIPVTGLGTYLSKKKEVEHAVEHAIRAGYRHLDLALVYANQDEVGAALKKVIPSVVKREDLFITTKLWNTNHRPENVPKDLDRSLKQLEIDYVDLWLMHWPVAFLKGSTELDNSVTVAETWIAMSNMLKTGKVKNVGVSNFTVSNLKQLIAATGIKPAVNQVELHPFLQQDELLEYCAREGIHVTAYFPLGGQASKKRPSLMNHPVVNEVTKNYPNATTAQVLLAWARARGYSVIPKSVTPDRIKSNFRVIELTPEDRQKITDIGKGNQKRFVTTKGMFKWNIGIFDEPDEAGLPKALISRDITAKL